MDAGEVRGNKGEKKPFIQFSKVVVVFVTVAVTGLCTAAVRLAYRMSDAGNMVNAVKAYIEYATIAFVAYSGNSAVEKWLVYHRTGMPGTQEIERLKDGDG